MDVEIIFSHPPTVMLSQFPDASDSRSDVLNLYLDVHWDTGQGERASLA